MPGYNSQRRGTASTSQRYIYFLFIFMYVPFSVFGVLFVCKCVLYYCHWVSTQLQLKINDNKIKTNLMHCLSSVYSITIPLHVSDLLVAHHQEVTICICNKWYVFYVLVTVSWPGWDGAGYVTSPISTRPTDN
jgi:hypothetical protein